MRDFELPTVNGTNPSTIHYALGDSTLGTVLVAASEKGICAIFLGDDAETLVGDLQRRFCGASFQTGDPLFARKVAGIIRALETPGGRLDFPLDLRGTPFQREVWQALTRIPSGVTVSYTEIAAQVGRPRSVRAVAQACGANPIAIAVPCHRVLRRDGNLSGYRWGVARKKVLLQTETLLNACAA